MKIPELSSIIIVLLLFILSIVFFTYSLVKLRNKIELYKMGVTKSKNINKLVIRMKKLGKFWFYFYQGIVIWGLFLSILITLFSFLHDKFIDKEEVMFSDVFKSFIIQFVFLSIYGLFYARTVWKSLHKFIQLH